MRPFYNESIICGMAVKKELLSYFKVDKINVESVSEQQKKIKHLINNTRLDGF